MQKRVICLETGEVYESVGEAARSVGRKISTLSRHLHGERPSCGGRHFQLYTDYQAEHICDLCPDGHDCPGHEYCETWRLAQRGIFRELIGDGGED